MKKLSLIKVCSLNKQNSHELLDCWLLFHLFCRLGRFADRYYKKDEFLDIYVLCFHVPFNTNTAELDTQVNLKRSLIYKLPHKLPNDLRVRTFGNKEILAKFQDYMGTRFTHF